ncbi:hypothetical protein LguiA_007835 [Lonicera macranthoides]
MTINLDDVRAILSVPLEGTYFKGDEVCCDLYKDHRDARPLHEVSYYYRLIVSFDMFKAYYPNRVYRQFSQVQTISTMPMIKPKDLTRGKTSNVYKVVYTVSNRWQ